MAFIGNVIVYGGLFCIGCLMFAFCIGCEILSNPPVNETTLVHHNNP